MKHAKVLYQFPDSAGKPFRPCNGTEGDMFDAAVCANCTRDAAHRSADRDTRHLVQCCDIIGRVMCFDRDDDMYPREWQFSEEGWPTCLAFEPKAGA